MKNDFYKEKISSPFLKKKRQRRKSYSLKFKTKTRLTRSQLRAGKISVMKKLDVTNKIVEILKRPVDHDQFIKDIESFGARKKCTSFDPCFVAEGTFANTYKTCTTTKCYLIKIRKPNREFDIAEFKINQDGFKKIRKLAKFPLIAQPLGVFGTSKNPLAFVYVFEEKSSTLGEFIESTDFSFVEFQALIFQIALVLYELQQALPGFCHNDLHTDNILVVSEPHLHSFTYKSLEFKTKFFIRLIDFGQASTNKIKTQDSLKIWKGIMGNTMSDFLRIANWIILIMYKVIAKSKSSTLEKCVTELLLLLSEFVTRDCVKNGGRAETKTGRFLSMPWLSLNRRGEEYLQELYGGGKPNAMNLLLKHSFFK